MRRVLQRDARAIDELGERLGCVPRLVGAANRRLGAPLSQEQQTDLVQDVILILWQKLETFEGRSTLEGWAWTYVHFQTKNRVRSVGKRRREAQLDLESLPTAPMSSPWPDIFSRGTIDHVLESLPSAMAVTIRLKHFEGLKFREIAERQSVSENTAKTRYYRGLARAREILREMGQETIDYNE